MEKPQWISPKAHVIQHPACKSGQNQIPKEEYKKTQMTLDLSNLQASNYQGLNDFLTLMFMCLIIPFIFFQMKCTRLLLNFCKLLVHPNHVEIISTA